MTIRWSRLFVAVVGDVSLRGGMTTVLSPFRYLSDRRLWKLLRGTKIRLRFQVKATFAEVVF